ncbi:hypothetical protein V6N12_041382 [Hibiscus sabdariffa]|uniref:Uncharacterized protein n=1 Tax=Hibiscus sabdariffa TaxID=183260 RepID=A0ABR2E6J5_9ROSI
MVFSGAGWTPGSGVPPVELCFYRLAHRWKQPTAGFLGGGSLGLVLLWLSFALAFFVCRENFLSRYLGWFHI